ncbi:MAG: carboxypeptidase regulatory-like domain-containing protein [Planctomycetota bacterium]
MTAPIDPTDEAAAGPSDASSAAATPAKMPTVGDDLDGTGSSNLAAADRTTRSTAQPASGLRVHVLAGGTRTAQLRLTCWRQQHGGTWARHATGKTDAAGIALLAVTQGRYRISLDAPKVVRAPLRKIYSVRSAVLRDIVIRVPAPCTAAGRVVDATGRPLPMATVTLQPWVLRSNDASGVWPQTQTDASGRFLLPLLAPGRASLRITHPGHPQADHSTGELAAGLTADVGDIRLAKGGQLRGRVISTAGEPLPDARVAVVGTQRSASTDPKGRFELVGVASHSLLYVTCDGHRSKSVKTGSEQPYYPMGALHWSNPDQPLDIELERGLRIQGSVTSDHLPVEVLAQLHVDHMWTQYTPAVDAQGTFVIKDLQAGQLRIQARAPGFGYSDLLSFDLTKDTSDLALTVRPTRTLRIQVVDEARSWLSGATVTIRGHSLGSSSGGFRSIFGLDRTVEAKRTDPHGIATYEGVFDGTWTIQVAADGHKHHEEELELQPSATSDARAQNEKPHVVPLTSQARLQVTVRDVPLAWADELRIYCLDTQSDRRAKTVPLHEMAAGIDLPPGAYELALGPAQNATAMLGQRNESVPTQAVTLAAGHRTTRSFTYIAMPRVRGQLLLPGSLAAPTHVYAMRPEAWTKCCEDAHFLNFHLDTVASRAPCAADGSFEYLLAEKGRWLFVASFATSPIPLRLGEANIEGAATPTFQVPGSMLQGSLHPDFRRRDGTWPQMLLVPPFLSSHDPFYQPSPLSQDFSSAFPSPMQMFRFRPDANGRFAMGPLQPDNWTLTLRDRRQLLLARDIPVGTDLVDLGEQPRPASGTLTVAVRNFRESQAAILRTAAGAYLLSASNVATNNVASSNGPAAEPNDGTTPTGTLTYGTLPYGAYRLELGTDLAALFISSETFVDIQHTPTGTTPASILFTVK